MFTVMFLLVDHLSSVALYVLGAVVLLIYAGVALNNKKVPASRTVDPVAVDSTGEVRKTGT